MYIFTVIFCTLWVVVVNIQPPHLLIIAFDGFRWDYISRYNAVTFKKLANSGVDAPDGLIPVFTTKTYPNFWTIATGLYEESHGIIDNSFYDPLYRQKFSMFKPQSRDPKWWGGEPIWVTAKKQGKSSGVFFWPGSNVPIDGIRPDFWRTYNSKVPFEVRVDTVFDWFQNENIDIGMMYFNEPDHLAHKVGSENQQIAQQIRKLDGLLDYILGELTRRGLANKTNILVVSDHGMTDVDVENEHSFIYLSDYINTKGLDIPQAGAVASVNPPPQLILEVYHKLKNVHPNMKVYLKDEIPERLHYRFNRRIMPILLVPDEGFLIRRDRRQGYKAQIGQHGYDNRFKSMRPIFIASGPAFKKGYRAESFETVNLYTLMCTLLGIRPAPNNGSLSNVKDILNFRF